MRLRMRMRNESGIALITAMLAVLLVSALMAGMFAAIQADQRGAATDRDQTQAYAAAHAGLEELTSNLASLFVSDVSPSVAQINAVAAAPPVIPGFEFRAPGGALGSGYTITFTDLTGPNGVGPADGIPDVMANADITTGPYTGFKGLITPYTMTVTARSATGGSEVRLRRGLQTVAIPVFQFGVFSDSDLSIFSGGGFNFGGRVHTNGSLFVAAQTSGTNNITFNDRITAVGEVVHLFLSNGLNVTTSSPTFNNQVLIPTSASTNRNLQLSPNEGSVTGMPGSAANGNWTTLSTGTYKNYIRTGSTGAKRLDLPLVSQGALPVDLIRRPDLGSNEDTARPLVFAQRFYSQASLRVLLSDRVADFTTLPTITATAPVLLNGVDGAAGNWTVLPPAGYGPVDATHPPIARSIGSFATTTTAASTYAAPFSQIPVAAIPAPFAVPTNLPIPQLFLRNNLGVDIPITCMGTTGPQTVAANGGNSALPANSFLGCNTGIGSAAPATVRGTVDGRVYVANVVGAVAASANGVIAVGANQTAPFSSHLIWVNNPNATVANTSVPVTCEGYADLFNGGGGLTSNTRRFLNCRGLTGAIANNQPITTSALANQYTGTIGGYIKIEKQDVNGVWTDVTMELLNLGIGAPNSGGSVCSDPTPNAVLRIQRLRDNGGDPATANQANVCTYNSSQNSTDWWPQALYDPREGSFRDPGAVAGLQTSPMIAAGVMQYIALDVANLKRWFAGTIGATGNQAVGTNGYIVYFSDRRGNHNPGDPITPNTETGEFGFEDQVNSTTANGQPDGVLQAGEDVNVGDPKWAAGTQQLYGATPWNNPVNIPTNGGGFGPFAWTAERPDTVIPLSATTVPAAGAGLARVNKVVLFRRALKLVNGGIVGGVNSLPTAGLTVVAENPVYVHGNYNAIDGVTPDATWSNEEPNVPAAIIADAIYLLSRAWSDARSFEVPNLVTSRVAATTGYRFAALAGKGLSFPYCAVACGSPGQLFGTDGGAANFLRMVEDWGGSTTHYRGSIISLHTNRQAIGTYKFNASGNTIYNAGGRNFTFDIDFLTPSLLPPGTPMFRDVNTLQFRQILRPNQ